MNTNSEFAIFRHQRCSSPEGQAVADLLLPKEDALSELQAVRDAELDYAYDAGISIEDANL